jgi:predicted nucleotidyltransferase
MGETGFHQATEQERVQALDAIRSALHGRHEIDFAFLYGSFTSEQFFRDIDVAVFLRESETASLRSSTYESRLSLEIEEAMSWRFPVEARVLNGAPLPFCFQVIRGELIFCRKDELLTQFMVSVARSYLDIAPLRRHYMLEAMA